MKEGYLKLYRKFQQNPFWTEKRKFSKAEAWIDILFTVRYQDEPERVIIKNKILECKMGESLKSLSTWGERWGWSTSAVVRFFELLKKLEQIETVNEKVTNRLIVCNYSTYNIKRNDNNLNTESNRNESEMKVKTEEERKERKKVNKGRFTPPTIQEISAYCLERKNNVDPKKFFYHYEANGWMIGKNKMKSWKAAIVTWERNNKQTNNYQSPPAGILVGNPYKLGPEYDN